MCSAGSDVGDLGLSLLVFCRGWRFCLPFCSRSTLGTFGNDGLAGIGGISVMAFLAESISEHIQLSFLVFAEEFVQVHQN